MNNSSRDDYLRAEVLTASPQKLQLMLIQAAIRNVQQGKDAVANDDKELASERLLKAQDILGQILAGLRSEHEPELVGKVAAIYVFALRSLVEGMLASDTEKLSSVLRVLEEERQTWTQLCTQLGESAGPAKGLSGPHRQRVFDSLPADAQAVTGEDSDDTTPSGPFSLEA